MASLLIGSPVAGLRLSRADGSDVRVIFDLPGLHAEADLDESPACGWADLLLFFEALLADWNGWEGTRTWSSTDGVLRIEATSGIWATVRLTQHPGVGADAPWSAEGEIHIEPGEQLLRVVEDLRTFVAAR